MCPRSWPIRGLRARPLFVPSVGNFRQGMLVSRSRCFSTTARQARSGADLEARAGVLRRPALCPRRRRRGGGKLEPEALNGTNDLELRVFANEARRQAVLVARLDNLGKGASGAAVQNLELMLGL